MNCSQLSFKIFSSIWLNIISHFIQPTSSFWSRSCVQLNLNLNNSSLVTHWGITVFVYCLHQIKIFLFVLCLWQAKHYQHVSGFLIPILNSFILPILQYHKNKGNNYNSQGHINEGTSLWRAALRLRYIYIP